MVIHEENEAPVELPVIRKPVLLQSKKYIVVKNHVREVLVSGQISDERDSENKESSETLAENSEPKSKKKKLSKTRRQNADEPQSESNFLESSEDVLPSTSSSDVDETKDLEELRSVYFKCKAILNKIETKYGNILNLKGVSNECDSGLADNSISHKRRKRPRENTAEKCEAGTSSAVAKCTCQQNKKIVFDDYGNETLKSPQRTNHICVHNTKPTIRSSENNLPNQHSVNINYSSESDEEELPDNLLELMNLLHDQNLELKSRNKIIQKIKEVKQDCINELKYHKVSIIEKLKKNPEELLDFRGTNLASLQGYV